MRYILLVTVLIAFTGLKAQQIDYLKKVDCKILMNEKYGEYERNVFDIILPNSKNPTALVIFIHGGGFVKGDKTQGLDRKEDVRYFLAQNVAFASLNYRFYNSDDSLGVKLCLSDIQRAIQYIRFNAEKYNIDKSLIGCYGNSAGAGSSLYFALHDDLAVKNDTTILGESTKLKCAGAMATQATYNLFRWKSFIPGLGLALIFKRKMFYTAIANFYGYPSYKDFKPNKKTIPRSLDMLKMIDSNDPPIYVMNLMKERLPKNMSVIQHHRKHAMKLAKVLKQNGLEYKLYTQNKAINKENDIDYPVREFLVQHLK